MGLRQILEEELGAEDELDSDGKIAARDIEKRIVEEITSIFDQAAAAAAADGALGGGPTGMLQAFLLGYIRGGMNAFIGDNVELACAPDSWSSIVGKAVR
jgi:hypothetical protein